MKPDQYLIRYIIDFGKFSAKDPRSKNTGLTENLIMISCIERDDGAYSQDWRSFDGNTMGEMDNFQVFKAWILMANSLKDKEDLDPNLRGFIASVWETWRQAVLDGRGEESVNDNQEGAPDEHAP